MKTSMVSSHIATQLAVAVKGIGREGSAVIGIEGPWGSGKTSLLNLLRNALVEQIEECTFVLTISPWLDGSNTSLVASLLLPVANIIAAEEEQRLAPEERAALRRRKSLTRTAKTMIDYTRQLPAISQPSPQPPPLFPAYLMPVAR